MKRIYFNPAILLLGLLFVSCERYTRQELQAPSEAFTFAFMTDIHLNFNNPGSFDGFRQAIAHARQQNAEFIITGGDNVDADVVGDDEAKARELFVQFKNIIDESEMDVKVTIGNHDRFWYQLESAGNHGTELFSEFFPQTYYYWDHKGVRFFHLNTAEVCDEKYCVSPAQQAWLQQALVETPTEIPVFLIVHVPFLSFYYPALYGRYTHTDVFDGFKDIWDMFKGHNLQLVLQGHMHLYEELNVLNTQFITGGAVSGGWWSGAYHGTEEGFVLIHWDGGKPVWSYEDFGWNAVISD